MRPVQLFFASAAAGMLLAAPASTAEPPGAIAGRIDVEGADDLEHTVVYLPDLKGRGAPSKATMAQSKKTLVPPVLPILAGSTVDFPNFDPLFHNVYSLSKTKSFDLGLYPERETRSVTFETPGVVDVYCSIHPSMHAVILVLDNPFFAETDKTGRFKIAGVPAGRHQVAVWRQGKISGVRTVTVSPRATATLSVTLRKLEKQP